MAARPKPLTLVGMTARCLRRQPVRTALTVLGVSLGVVAMVAFTTMIRGMTASLDVAIRTGGTDMMIFQEDTVGDIFSNLDEESTRAALLGDPGVEAVAAGLVQIVPTTNSPLTVCYGLRPDEYLMQSGELVSGRPLAGPGEAMIGPIAQRQLKLDVGDTLTIHGRDLKIVGTFESDVVFFNAGVIVTLPEMQEMVGREGQVTTFMVKLRPRADLEDVRRRLEANVPRITTITNAVEYARMDRGLEAGEAMVWAVSFLAIVIGSIIVMNTMWMTVLERTREIGVLRAVGWSRRRVMSMVLMEAACVGLLACILGCALGVGLAELTTVMPVAANFNDPVYDAPVFALALGVTLTLSLIGAAAPAYRATLVSPAEALRYE